MAGETITECVVGDIAAPSRNALVGGPFGSDLVSRDYVQSGVPVIRGTNMGHGRWVSGEFAYVTPEKADSLASNCAKRGDLVFTQRGTLGQVALVPNKGMDRYLISQSQMKLTVDVEKADALFVYYVFTGAEQQAYIRQNAIQTGVPHTNLGILRNTPLTLPPLTEQKAIATMLGALDDKIELNQRMNVTLEKMARALFQSWFVDFDPVRAKLEGRQPIGLDEATAALFPKAFHETKLGHIPVGWQAGRLGDLCNLKRGHDLPTSNRTAGVVPVISSSGISGTHIETNVRGPGVVTGRYGTIGKVFYIETDYWPLNTTLYVDDFKANPPRFIFHALGEVNYSNYNDKAAVPGVNRNHLHEEPTVLPPMEVRHAFVRIITPLWSQHAANDCQSRTLATLRDSLLPKLLSGILKINNKIGLRHD